VLCCSMPCQQGAVFFAGDRSTASKLSTPPTQTPPCHCVDRAKEESDRLLRLQERGSAANLPLFAPDVATRAAVAAGLAQPFAAASQEGRVKTTGELVREALAAREPVWAHEGLLPLWLVKGYEERVSAAGGWCVVAGWLMMRGSDGVGWAGRSMTFGLAYSCMDDAFLTKMRVFKVCAVVSTEHRFDAHLCCPHPAPSSLQLRREAANSTARQAAAMARRQLAAPDASESAVQAARAVVAQAAAAAADECGTCGGFHGEDEELDALWICCDTCNRCGTLRSWLSPHASGGTPAAATHVKMLWSSTPALADESQHHATSVKVWHKRACHACLPACLPVHARAFQVVPRRVCQGEAGPG
jgi:hypothetical protein